ncbi:hypothetical protein T439DRAFT_382929 [Meredithblackwellia eburnea MCA 4105]
MTEGDSQPVKRTRSSIACGVCHKKKSRCDVGSVGIPCTDCKRLGKVCELIESRRGKHPRVKKVKGVGSERPSTTSTTSDTASVRSDSTAMQAENGEEGSSDDIVVGPFSQATLVLPDSEPIFHFGNEPSVLELFPEANSTSDSSRSSGFAALYINNSPGTIEVTASGSQINMATIPIAAPQLPPEQATATSPVLRIAPSLPTNRSPSLSNVFSAAPPSAGTASTSVPRHFSPFSPASAGTPSVSESTRSDHRAVEGAEILVNLMERATHDPNAEHDSRQVTYLPEISTHGLMVRNFLGSKRIHFSVPVSRRTDAIPAPSPSVTTQQIDTLRKIGCFDLPSRNIMDTLVSSYFKYSHASYPLIDEFDFNARYAQVEQGRVPLLLLWSVLFVGALNCDPELLLNEWSSRKEALASFYDKAKSLCDVEYGDDRIVTVQAMLLLAQNWARPTEVRADAYYWITNAVGLAQVLGMHRDTSRSKMSAGDRRLWRRIWWCCVCRDSSTAAGIGRPFRIQIDFADVELPTLADFEDPEGAPPYETLVFRSATTIQERQNQAHYFVETCKLTLLGYEVLKLQFRLAKGEITQSVLERQDASFRELNEWVDELPSSMRLGSSRESSWTNYLHLQWNLWVLYLHRHTDSDEHRKRASKAAAAMTRLFEDIVAVDIVKHVPGHAVACILAALVQHSRDRHTAKDATAISLAQNRIRTCMLAAKVLSATRPTASWFVSLFLWLEQAQNHIIRSRKSSPQPSGPTATDPSSDFSALFGADIPDFTMQDIDWNNLSGEDALFDFLADPSAGNLGGFDFEAVLQGDSGLNWASGSGGI